MTEKTISKDMDIVELVTAYEKDHNHMRKKRILKEIERLGPRAREPSHTYEIMEKRVVSAGWNIPKCVTGYDRQEYMTDEFWHDEYVEEVPTGRYKTIEGGAKQKRLLSEAYNITTDRDICFAIAHELKYTETMPLEKLILQGDSLTHEELEQLADSTMETKGAVVASIELGYSLAKTWNNIRRYKRLNQDQIDILDDLAKDFEIKQLDEQDKTDPEEAICRMTRFLKNLYEHEDTPKEIRHLAMDALGYSLEFALLKDVGKGVLTKDEAKIIYNYPYDKKHPSVTESERSLAGKDLGYSRARIYLHNKRIKYTKEWNEEILPDIKAATPCLGIGATLGNTAYFGYIFSIFNEAEHSPTALGIGIATVTGIAMVGGAKLWFESILR